MLTSGDPGSGPSIQELKRTAPGRIRKGRMENEKMGKGTVRQREGVEFLLMVTRQWLAGSAGWARA